MNYSIKINVILIFPFYIANYYLSLQFSFESLKISVLFDYFD